MADLHKNFAASTVATAPSPALGGTSLVLAPGGGALMPTAPFNATVWPAGAGATAANAEIVRVTAVAADTLTIARTQEGSTARTIVVGDQIAATITAQILVDAESAVANNIKGAWVFGTAYKANDIVTASGVTYVSTSPSTGFSPDSATGYTKVGANHDNILPADETSFVSPASMGFTLNAATTVRQVSINLSPAAKPVAGIKMGIATDWNSSSIVPYIASHTITAAEVAAITSAGWYTYTLDADAVLAAGTTYRLVTPEIILQATPTPVVSGVVATIGSVLYGTTYNTMISPANFPFRLHSPIPKPWKALTTVVSPRITAPDASAWDVTVDAFGLLDTARSALSPINHEQFYADSVLAGTAGPVPYAFYRLKNLGTTSDSTANARHLAVIGTAPTYPTTGMWAPDAGGARWTALNTSAQVPFVVTAGGWAVAGFFKADVFPRQLWSISRSTTGDVFDAANFTADGSVSAGLYLAGQAASAPGLVIPNTWYHVIVIADNARLKIYLNGVKVADVASTFGTGESTQVLWLHQPSGSGDTALDIADLSLYNPLAMTDAQAIALYGAATADPGARSNLVIEAPVTKTSAYTAVGGEFVEADATTAAFTVTLPATPKTGAAVTVKKIDASVNAVTVAGTATATIDGGTTYVLNNRWQTVRVVYDGTRWVTSGGTGASSLTWAGLPFSVNWRNYSQGTGLDTSFNDGSYSKDAQGVVRIRGLVQKTTALTAAGDQIAILPVGFRPAKNHFFYAISGDAGGFGRLAVNIDGTVTLTSAASGTVSTGSGAVSFVSLDVSFAVN